MSTVYSLPKSYARKEAGVEDAALASLKLIGYLAAFTALAPGLIGVPTGVIYSNMTTPSDSDIKNIETEALTNEVSNLTERLKSLPARKARNTGSDVAWRGGIR